MRTTTRDIERQIGALQREIDKQATALERTDPMGTLPLPRVLMQRRAALCPLFMRLNALKARLPEGPQIKPQTMEALLCLMDQVDPLRSYEGRRGVRTLVAAWTAH